MIRALRTPLRRSARLLAAAGLGLALLTPHPAAACGDGAACLVRADGADSDGPVLGEYLVHRPSDAPEGPLGAIIFVHGWQATAAAMMKNKRLKALADRLGVLLVTPQGERKTWSYPGSPSQHRDEFAFFEALRRDLVGRHGADPDRLMITGFSMGASMAWFVACAQGARYAAAAPMAGAFWDPIPARCASPPRVLAHLHGRGDGVVPIEGRPIGRAYRQSDAWASFEAMRASVAPTGAWTRTDQARNNGYECAVWRNGAGATDRLFEFCRHDGGHLWRTSWIERVWTQFVSPDRSVIGE